MAFCWIYTTHNHIQIIIIKLLFNNKFHINFSIDLIWKCLTPEKNIVFHLYSTHPHKQTAKTDIMKLKKKKKSKTKL